ncbi:hypothetical protein H0X06_02895 [Candidatus Dependentiae bacterium]|nr:hypothetical protein [Candidatus Dependentiae bacterium]
MKLLIKVILLFLSAICIPGWKIVPLKQRRNQLHINRSFFSGPLKEGAVTVIIHGTKSSFFSRTVSNLEYPHGINPFNLIRTRSILSTIAHTLHTSCPKDFPLDSFYFYSWEGHLTFESRFQAAKKLYPILRSHTGPLTIITHSHGANVALYLAHFAHLDNNKDFAIDRLILLAPPIQEVTKPYACSNVFKEIYNLYSSADFMQIADMQGLYPESYKYTAPTTKIPLFSERIFPPAPHILQARILLDGQSPSHLHFLLTQFIKQLPLLLDLTKQAARFSCTKNFCILNIPRGNQAPHYVHESELKKNYIPRSQRDRITRLTPFKSY